MWGLAEWGTYCCISFSSISFLMILIQTQKAVLLETISWPLMVSELYIVQHSFVMLFQFWKDFHLHSIHYLTVYNTVLLNIWEYLLVQLEKISSLWKRTKALKLKSNNSFSTTSNESCFHVYFTRNSYKFQKSWMHVTWSLLLFHVLLGLFPVWN